MFAHPDYFLFATGGVELATRRLHHGADDAADQHVRVEPRRHPAEIATTWLGDRRARASRTRRRLEHVDRPHRHAADDAHAARSQRRLRARRSRHRGRARQGRRCPSAVRQHLDTVQRARAAYKQLNAPFGVVRDEHAARPRRGDQERHCSGRQPLHLDREPDRDAHHVARRAGHADQERASTRRLRRRSPSTRPRLMPGSRRRRRADRPGRGAGRFDLSRATSEGSSSRHWPGSSPSSVSPA